MRYLKLLTALAMAVVGMMALGGPASATVLTSPEGTQLGAGVTIHFKEKNGKWKFVMTGGEILCNKFTVHLYSTNAGSTIETIDFDVTSVRQEECNATVTTIKPGTVEFHTRLFSPDRRATVTWSGEEITVEFLGIHCIFGTSNTDVGTLTGGSPAVFTAEGSIPRVGGRSGAFCGSAGTVSAEYEVDTPSSLYVD
jgi:hypothetical protein